MKPISEPTPEPESEPESEPEPTPSERHYYVSVSDRVWDPETVIYFETPKSVCEIDQTYEEAGQVYIGELTKKQSVILQTEFGKLYKGQYVVGFEWDETYPPENLTSRVLLNNYALLTDDQKKVLDIALHLANSIRKEDGCGSKNIATQSTQGEQPPVESAVIDSPPCVIAANGNPQSAVNADQESIESANGPVDVIVKNMPSKKDIADVTFDATYRAMARFQEPIEETKLEKVHRLRQDGWEWKRIIHQAYYPDENIEDITDIDSEVSRIQKQYYAAYPKSAR